MYRKELNFLKDCFRKAYALFCDQNKRGKEKAAFDIVTEVDCSIEAFLVKQIEDTFPGDVIHSEEFRSHVCLRDRTWILDPIDGTFNFSSGSPLFGLQGAFWDQGKLCFSVIFLPALDEMYEAYEKEGAYCNGKRISVSNRKPQEAIVSFGDFPHARPQDAMEQKQCMEFAFSHIAKFRMFGASSVDFAYLASGKIDGTVLFTKNKWDLAPGALLVQEAGGFLFDEKGEEYRFDSRCIYAMNSKEMFQAVFQKGESDDPSQ